MVVPGKSGYININDAIRTVVGKIAFFDRKVIVQRNRGTDICLHVSANTGSFDYKLKLYLARSTRRMFPCRIY